MEVVTSIIKILLLIIVLIILVVISIGIVQVMDVFKSVIKSRKKHRKLAIKYRFSRHIKYSLLMKKYIKCIDVIKWVIYDIIKGKPNLKLFGIWCFTGYFGQGKTIGAVMYALHLRKQYEKMGIYVHIYTNFDMRFQDGKIKSWEDLLNLPKYTIVIFDEIQSTFTSQRFKEFPIELLWKLTQCRKQQLCVFASSPVFNRMSIQLRENTDIIVKCKNILSLDRWFNYKFYNVADYERYQDSEFKLFRKALSTLNCVASNRDYASYNTSEIVQRIDITGENKDKKKRISQTDLKIIENNLRKYVEKEMKKHAEK